MVGRWRLVSRWSPDGTRVTIRSGGNYGIDSTTVIVNADGTGTPLTLTVGAGSGFASWSTYGTRLGFHSATMASDNDVYVAAPDGTAALNITDGLTSPYHAWQAWRPQPMGPVGLVDRETDVGSCVTSGVGSTASTTATRVTTVHGRLGLRRRRHAGLYRQSDGYVYLRNTNTQGIADIKFFFGNPGDVPLAGDFDGDGCDTVGIPPSEQRFYIINELGETTAVSARPNTPSCSGIPVTSRLSATGTVTGSTRSVCTVPRRGSSTTATP